MTANKIENSFGIRRLILQRRRECGIGLCGSCEAIARWLFKNHNIVTSTDFVARVLRGH